MKTERETNHFFEQHTVQFHKSRAQEWKILEQKIDDKQPHSRPFVSYLLAVAAMFLIALTFIFQFGEKAFRSERGEQKMCTLPDGSKVHLNAETKLSYSPLAWYISRKVNLEGEAFFEVEKGSRFTVISALGNTQVLGTSFNVYARADAYKVSCVTGKVKVHTQSRSFNIEPGESIVWEAKTKTLRQTEQQQKSLLAWQHQRLLFKAKPLRQVFDELERQYAIYIAYYSKVEDYEYSGNLSLETTIEENLNIVCKPFGMEWEKSERKDKNLYIIK